MKHNPLAAILRVAPIDDGLSIDSLHPWQRRRFRAGEAMLGRVAPANLNAAERDYYTAFNRDLDAVENLLKPSEGE